ncbi:hypothetical protein BDD12DRAFT_895399 [Trichophaea hybrida]|nr:hypothetical protein BDD12DRAFT_895399 [Trichophaea hybrida]
MKSTFTGGPAFGVFYKEEEFADVMKQYATRFSSPLPLADEAKLFLFNMTNGHPGAVHGLAYFLQIQEVGPGPSQQMFH